VQAEAERTGCSLLVYALWGDAAHRRRMPVAMPDGDVAWLGTTVAVPWHVGRPDMWKECDE
jgi:hypothetical protein